MRSFFNKAIDDLDITLAAIGCVASIPLTIVLQFVLKQPSLTAVGIICFISFFIYLITRLKRQPLTFVNAELNPTWYLLINIAFFLLFTCSTIILYTRPEPYIRPLVFFILLTAMTVLLAMEIVLLPRHKYTNSIALLKIIIIGLTLQWSQLLIYPDSLIGTDPWYHQALTQKIMASGQISGRADYSLTVLFHLITGITSLVTGLSYKAATMLSVGLPHVLCDTLFIFLIGKFIHSPKAGLLGALFLATANLQIYFGIETIPSTIGIMFIPIIVYLLFKVRKEKSGAHLALIAVLMFALLMTHALAAVLMGALCFLIWIGFWIYKKLRYKSPHPAKIFFIVGIIFTVVTLVWFTFGSGQMNVLLRMVSHDLATEYFGSIAPDIELPEAKAPETKAPETKAPETKAPETTAPETKSPGTKTPETTVPNAAYRPGALTPQTASSPEIYQAMERSVEQYRQSISQPEQLFKKVNIFIFFALALIGSFVLFSKKHRNIYGFSLVFGGLAILVVTFLTAIASRYFFVSRGVYFLQVILSIPVGIAFLWVSGLIRNKAVSAILTGSLVCLLAFITFVSPQVNMDNRTFSANSKIRLAFTQSELAALSTAFATCNSVIGSDWYADYYIYQRYTKVGLKNPSSKDISEQLYTGDYSPLRQELILIRGEITHQPFLFFQGAYRLNYDPEDKLKEQGFQRVYTNGSTSCFIQ